VKTFFLLQYEGADDYVARRTPHREAHLALVREASGRGEIVMAGAVNEPPSGAMFVFREQADAERFAKRDPYVLNGVAKSWRIVPWHVVTGENV
jgi:uncharacterized protein YciI